METLEIFGVQFVLSVIVFALIAKWYAAPWLAHKSKQVALGLLILPHAFRHIGLTFLTPAGVKEGIPSTFATAAAYGDFASGILAILALIALRRNWPVAMALVWVFSLAGLADLLNALLQAEAVLYSATVWSASTSAIPGMRRECRATDALMITEKNMANCAAPCSPSIRDSSGATRVSKSVCLTVSSDPLVFPTRRATTQEAESQ